jgi:hypothetical protein
MSTTMSFELKLGLKCHVAVCFGHYKFYCAVTILCLYFDPIYRHLTFEHIHFASMYSGFLLPPVSLWLSLVSSFKRGGGVHVISPFLVSLIISGFAI